MRAVSAKAYQSPAVIYAFALSRATITCMKQPRVSLRSTLGYVLLRLQRDNYLKTLTLVLRPLTLDLRP